MQSLTDRVTTMDQLYSVAKSMQAPVLMLVDGTVEWSNRSFLERFAVRAEVMGKVEIKELLWCLGLPEAVAGMMAEGQVFERCPMPVPRHGENVLFLRHVRLPAHSDGRKRMMLVLGDEFDPEPAEICIGDN